jgi:hypothetical protein
VLEGQQYCDSCYDELGLGRPEPKDVERARRSRRQRQHLTPTEARQTGMEAGSTGACITLGIAFMLVGFYFLALAPGESTGFDALPQVANLHRLTIGETCSIVGAIFLAAGIRPRWTGRSTPESAPDRHTTDTAERQPLDY